MTEDAELYAGWKKHKQEKRASNRVQSAELLDRADVKYEVRNEGAHLIVDTCGTHPNQTAVDFWPGTGLWIRRDNHHRQRGVHSLIKFIKHGATNGKP